MQFYIDFKYIVKLLANSVLLWLEILKLAANADFLKVMFYVDW